MAAPLPIYCTWQGDVFTPLPRHARACDERFVVGAVYALEEVQERSAASHKQFFASVNEAWKNLPDEAAERFPTPDALRKFALIKTGYRDERSIQCASRPEALRVAAFIRPMDEFAVVTVTGATVTVFTAKSQSMKAMGKTEFQHSKQSVLDYIADMLGTETKALEGAAAAV